MKKNFPLAALVLLLVVVAAVLVAAPQSVSADAPPDVPTVHSSFVLESQWDFEAYVGGPEPRQVYINGQLTSLAMCGYCYHMTMQPGETRDVQVLVNWPNMHSHWFNYRVGAFEGPGTIRANLDGIVVPVVEVQTNFENRWAVTWYVDSNPHPDLAGAVRYYVIDGGRDGGSTISAAEGFDIYSFDDLAGVWVPIEDSFLIETFETIAVVPQSPAMRPVGFFPLNMHNYRFPTPASPMQLVRVDTGVVLFVYGLEACQVEDPGQLPSVAEIEVVGAIDYQSVALDWYPIDGDQCYQAVLYGGLADLVLATVNSPEWSWGFEMGQGIDPNGWVVLPKGFRHWPQVRALNGDVCWSGPNAYPLNPFVPVVECVAWQTNVLAAEVYMPQMTWAEGTFPTMSIWSQSGGEITAEYQNGTVCRGAGVQVVRGEPITITFHPAVLGEHFGQGEGEAPCGPESTKSF